MPTISLLESFGLQKGNAMHPTYVRWFSDIGVDDVPLVGGKNASLGEMYRELAARGVRVPNGFAITAQAYADTCLLYTSPSPRD